MSARTGVVTVAAIMLFTSLAEAQVIVRERWHYLPGHPAGRVITHDYYVPVYDQQRLRYFYPAFQAVGDGDHYLQVGDGRWRLVKVAKDVYIFGPGYCLITHPFHFGPGTVNGAGWCVRRIGVPLFPFLRSFPLGFVVIFE